MLRLKGTASRFIILLAILSYGFAHGQDLRKVCPVILKTGSLTDSLSFVLTTLDNNLYKHKPLKYASSIEIIDADAPWPPRWYALHSSDTSIANKPTMMLMLNASYENERFRFFTMAAHHQRNELAVLSCDKNMVPVDTFFAWHKVMDSHDFISSPDGHLMYFALHDTVVDLRSAYGDPAELAINMTYQTIEIAGPDGRSVFSWNPLAVLGFDAIYKPYRYTQGVRAGHSSFDWSHGNSLHYDYDGDILYSFKHIGIGKISRADGHVVWRIDRNKQKVNALSDSLPIFLQHDLQAVRDASGNITYTVLSNGDSLHPACRGLLFTVNFNEKNEPVVKLIKTIRPSEQIPNTGGGGNMDMDQDGSYLLNYGLFSQDSTLPGRTLFEYKDAKNNRSAIYQTAPTIFTFRAHPMNGWRPLRPVITLKRDQLTATTKLKTAKWYRLSGPDLKTVTYLGEGENYSPKENGFYCVATKYGVGWSVSKAFKYTKK